MIQSMEQYDVISIGNALIDAFLVIQENNMFARCNEQNNELCFTYGEKIHVESCQFLLGGNACNVGVGLSRLGKQTGLCVEIGDDGFSQKIRNLLAKEPIDTSLVQMTKGEPSSFAIGINFKGERTLFVEHVRRKHAFVFDSLTTQWIYLTSLGEQWKQVYSKVISFAKEKGVKIAFSPGTHQMEAGASSFSDVLQKAEMVFVNKEEAIRIANGKLQMANSQNEKASVRELLQAVKAMGPKIVSITDGAHGSYSIDEKGEIKVLGVFQSNVVELTGAGDGYAAGFLAAFMQGLTVSEGMRWGAVNASSVIQKIGAQPGLLTKEQIEKTVSEHKEFQPSPL